MKKKITKVLLASFLVFGLAGVANADRINYDRQAKVKKASDKIVSFCERLSNTRRGGFSGPRMVVPSFFVPSSDVPRFADLDVKDGFPVQSSDWECQPPGSGNNPVPEPATMLLLGAGIAGIAGVRLRKKNK